MVKRLPLRGLSPKKGLTVVCLYIYVIDVVWSQKLVQKLLDNFCSNVAYLCLTLKQMHDKLF